MGKEKGDNRIKKALKLPRPKDLSTPDRRNKEMIEMNKIYFCISILFLKFQQPEIDMDGVFYVNSRSTPSSYTSSIFRPGTGRCTMYS